VLVLLFLLLLQPAQPPTRWPIESLTVEGNSVYSASEVIAAAGLKLGQLAGKEEFEAARARLMETGFFGSAGYRFKPSASAKGIAATLEISEIAETYPVGFERLSAPSEELLAELKKSDPLFREKIPASAQVLSRYSKVIETFLSTRGDRLPVTGTLFADKQNRLGIVFGPSTRPPVIAEVRFTGSSVLTAAALQTAISGVAIGAPYTEAGFQDLLDAAIRPLYEARGRIRVAFPKVQVEPAQGVEGLAITVEVSEGEVYNLGQVRLGAGGFPEQELRKIAAFKTGQIADFSEVTAGVERVKARLRRSGYLKPEVSVARVIHDEQKTVDLDVSVEPGPQYLFGKLAIQGLALDEEAEVKRLWAVKPGAPFDEGYPNYFLQRLREDGVFDNLGKTRADINLDESSRTVNVTLSFAAAPRPPRRKK
jgi:outer membrane protein assembly factor BamA